MKKYSLLLFLYASVFLTVRAQTTTPRNSSNSNIELADTLAKEPISKFAQFNKKAEKLFKIIPVPIVSYSTETGSVFGMAKFNTINLVKGDTVSTPSSFSELVSFSTEGQFKAVVGSNIYLNKNKLNIKGAVAYIEFPEYILGVGNNVKKENLEQIKTDRLIFSNAFLVGINKENTLYVGVFQNYKNYLKIEQDSTGFLITNEYPGYKGGTLSGAGVGLILDKRDNRYYPEKGMYLLSNFNFYGNYLGSNFTYNSFVLDLRKYFNPWKNHVIAAQLYTNINDGIVPFYSLGMIGGTERMRGYYLGGIRDKVIADTQLEYRLHIGSVFGMVAFASAGTVANEFKNMDLGALWYGGGFGFRVLVDSESKVNLRLDFGFGQSGSRSVVLGFSEAF